MTGDRGTPVLLIHGAWQGSWSWDAFAPLLAEAGFRPVAVDLPGNGRDGTPPESASLDRSVAHLAQTLDALGGQAHVIGHSGGGIAASQLAEARPEGVLSLTYVAGMMLPDGVSFADLVNRLRPDHPEVAGIGPHLRWSPDRRVSEVPPEAAVTIFMQDCPPEAAAEAARKLTPQGESGRAIAPRLTPDRYGRVPRLYVEATQDRSVALCLQRLMQQLSPGARRESLPTGHVPQFSAPLLLARAVLPFLHRHDRGGFLSARPSPSDQASPLRPKELLP